MKQLLLASLLMVLPLGSVLAKAAPRAENALLWTQIDSRRALLS